MPSLRKRREIEAAEAEADDRLWLNRHCDDSVIVVYDPEEYERLSAEGVHVSLAHPASDSPEATRSAADEAYRLLEKYGEGAVVDSDYEIGFLEGKLSTLRWVLGLDWDELDT